ncbi:OprO/OprP family phosphate-selective porin [Blastopirellula sp. JC732]|uniref:OprO/OprP family phosphate-selective porin n=1 Tax=Blastopirellula sediminis TaxID=2894196 RepID=A0A9X1MUH3_9BACT|nr:OprO/OprP family phosphate-selective porin [Blastopirellula sediminis]MCC9604867.1 OprO/OprP family phosphate-selective porin [Blastopirellula sediminis]MCC9631834.1 OprO/OprP family phosphate-selective porin [Blastopirellula sediminis]
MSWLSRTAAAALLVGSALTGNSVFAQQSAQDELAEIRAQMAAQQAELQELRQKLELQPAYGIRPADPAACGGGPEIYRLPVCYDYFYEPSCCDDAKPPKQHVMKWYTTYDKGFVIRPFNPEENPYEIKFGGWVQLRYNGFAREEDSWTDNAGVTRPIRNRNEFEVERARLQISGYAIDPRLSYFIQLDGDTDGADTVDFFDYWWAWEFNDDQQVFLGKRKVPGSRQWILSAKHTRLADRPMAADFFRPGRTVGIFGATKVGENGYFEAMIGDGYRTENVPPSAIDDKLTFAATNYWDPFGDFGSKLTDYDWTCDPLMRIGHSFVYSPNAGSPTGTPLDESDFIRLSDGTRLTSAGALAPGVTLSEFDVYLYTMDFAYMWRGFSFDAEYYMRWIQNLQANGALPVENLYQHGYFVEGGYFIVPKKLDFNLRYSYVSGYYGNRDEYAAGFNLYPCDTRNLKLTFDVTKVNGSPLNNTSSGILVGDDGLLFRTQFQAEY